MSDKPDWLDLESIIPLVSGKGGRDAEQITGLSADSIKRHYPQFVKQLSKRRRGIKLRHALEIADGQPRAEGQQRAPRRRARPVQAEIQSEM
jgi:hypothetical protein